MDLKASLRDEQAFRRHLAQELFTSAVEAELSGDLVAVHNLLGQAARLEKYANTIRHCQYLANDGQCVGNTESPILRCSFYNEAEKCKYFKEEEHHAVSG